jgi:GAF domain-containing protein
MLTCYLAIRYRLWRDIIPHFTGKKKLEPKNLNSPAMAIPDGKRSAIDDVNLIRTLAAFNEIGAQINRLGMSHDLPATLKLIVENAVQAVAVGATSPASNPPASAVIWIYDEAKRAFDPQSRVSAGEPPGASTDDFPRSDGLGMQAIQRRRRLLSYEERGRTIHPVKQAVGARSLACCPLIVSDEIVGLLYVYRRDDRRFTEIELLLLDNFVHLAAMAIHFGRKVGGMTQMLARKVNEQEKLARASRLINSRTNLEETLHEILSIGLDLTAAQYGSFELYDKDRLANDQALAGYNMDPALSCPCRLMIKCCGPGSLHRQSCSSTICKTLYGKPFTSPCLSTNPCVPNWRCPPGDRRRPVGILNIESPCPMPLPLKTSISWKPWPPKRHCSTRNSPAGCAPGD